MMTKKELAKSNITINNMLEIEQRQFERINTLTEELGKAHRKCNKEIQKVQALRKLCDMHLNAITDGPNW